MHYFSNVPYCVYTMHYFNNVPHCVYTMHYFIKNTRLRVVVSCGIMLLGHF
jgi:hypothetical protein